jgi:ABC-type antimicrobial peptide transport system permease subunit
MEAIEARFSQERLFAQAYAFFGGLALLVAAVGLFGVMSYSVARRVNEIGVRMALGAQRADVVRMIMRESMLLVVPGVMIGIAAAVTSGRLVAASLFGLQPTDAITISIAVLILLAVSTLAGYLPARRAARVDPMVALRAE